MLVCIYMIASGSYCRIVGMTGIFSFCQIPKALFWVEICGGHVSTPCSGSRSEMSSVTRHVILLKVVVTRWVRCGHEGMDLVSNNTQEGCAVNMMLNWYYGT